MQYRRATTYGSVKGYESISDREEPAGVLDTESKDGSSLSEDTYSVIDSCDDDSRWGIRSVEECVAPHPEHLHECAYGKAGGITIDGRD